MIGAILYRMCTMQHGVDGRFIKFCLLILIAIVLNLDAYPQQQKFTYSKTRILLLLDGSGSMAEKWGDQSKFEIASELIYNLVDSIEKTGEPVEFAIRVFGHQYPRSAGNCKDSKLEVGFSSSSGKIIRQKLSTITPQGWTPIAYSIYHAVNDFPDDPSALNAIILITDGLETCGGDICAAGRFLQSRRIALKPFIIGLGLDSTNEDNFKCLGTFYDASSRKSFHHTLNVVISQSLNTTTAQINLLDATGKATETNIEITIYDALTGEIAYNFVHSLRKDGLPDTLFLDPKRRYDITVHTFPPVEVTGIELTPGRHNIIPVDVPQGNLTIRYTGTAQPGQLQCVVRNAATGETINLHDLGTTERYLMGTYDIDILTFPPIRMEDVTISYGHPKEIKIDPPGILIIIPATPGIGSIYTKKEGKLMKILEIPRLDDRLILKILPGEYTFVYRSNTNRHAKNTVERNFRITSNTNTYIKL